MLDKNESRAQSALLQTGTSLDRANSLETFIGDNEDASSQALKDMIDDDINDDIEDVSRLSGAAATALLA